MATIHVISQLCCIYIFIYGMRRRRSCRRCRIQCRHHSSARENLLLRPNYNSGVRTCFCIQQRVYSNYYPIKAVRIIIDIAGRKENNKQSHKCQRPDSPVEVLMAVDVCLFLIPFFYSFPLENYFFFPMYSFSRL